MRLARLRALFDRYDADKSGTLGANALDHMLTELGGRDDASAGGGLLLAEFGDADGKDGRALSFDAFVRLVTMLESEAAEPRDDETTAAPARPISERMPRFSLSVVRAVTGGDDTSTRAHPHQTAIDETHQNVGVSPPAAPRAPPAPGEEPAATKSGIDDDDALAPPPPPSAVAPPPPQPAAAPPPARLKDGSGIRRSGDSADLFVLERFLASGGCGEVYRARQVETGGRFALKRVLVASQGTARWKDELSHCAEANVMLQLSRHENVMTMQYCIVFASEFFMFFDLIDGARDVDGTIKSGELYKGESGEAVRARCLSVLTQAAVAIAFVNEQGVLHEDVKHENGECKTRVFRDANTMVLTKHTLFSVSRNTPSSLSLHVASLARAKVMVDSRWHVKLVDFGFATQGSGFGASLRATFTGATPDFMSPETSELKKRLASLKERGDWEGYLEVKRTVLLSVPETDGWAWGIMAHAMLTCNDKLNSAANSLSELQRKTATALCREWGAGEIDEWARSLPMAGATKKVCAAIADSLKDAGLQDGLSLLALRPHNDEQTEDLRKAFKLRKAPGPSRGKIFQVRHISCVASDHDSDAPIITVTCRDRRKRCSRPHRRCARCSSAASRRARATARRRWTRSRTCSSTSAAPRRPRPRTTSPAMTRAARARSTISEPRWSTKLTIPRGLTPSRPQMLAFFSARLARSGERGD